MPAPRPPSVKELHPSFGTRSASRPDVLPGADGRTWAGRRFRELVWEMWNHLGGEPTPPQLAIIRRAAQLQVWAEREEASFADGGSFNVDAYCTATNTLRRLCADIGYRPNVRDVTPDLDDYLNGRAAK